MASGDPYFSEQLQYYIIYIKSELICLALVPKRYLPCNYWHPHRVTRRHLPAKLIASPAIFIAFDRRSSSRPPALLIASTAGFPIKPVLSVTPTAGKTRRVHPSSLPKDPSPMPYNLGL